MSELMRSSDNPATWSRRKKLLVTLAIYLFANVFIVLLAAVQYPLDRPSGARGGIGVCVLAQTGQNVVNPQTDDRWTVAVTWLIGERRIDARRLEKRRPEVVLGFDNRTLFGGLAPEWLFAQDQLSAFASSTYGLPFPFVERWVKMDGQVRTGWGVYWLGFAANALFFLMVISTALGISAAWKRWRSHREEKRGCCQNCGYDLSALPKGDEGMTLCPECGVSSSRGPRVLAK